MEESLQKIKQIIVRSCLGECTENERIRLEQWCAESQAHEDFYRRISSQDNLELKLRELSSINTQQAFIYNQRILRRRAVRCMVKRSLPYAACLVVVLGISLGWLLYDRQQEVLKDMQVLLPGMKQAELVLADGSTVRLVPEMYEKFQEGGAEIAVSGNSVDYSGCGTDTAMLYNTIRTPLGGEYVVVLSDGTEVWLNAMSQLTYPVNFRGNERTVKLSGEAYFKVKQDTSQPFCVDFRGYRVKVLGTTFNVKAYKDEDQWQATLCTGSVSLQDIVRKETIMLEPGKQAFYNINTRATEVREVETNLYTAWTKGEFRFDNTSVEEIFDVLKRWYTIEVFYENERVRHEVFTGKLPRFSNLQMILNIMEKVSDIHFELKGHTLLVR